MIDDALKRWALGLAPLNKESIKIIEDLLSHEKEDRMSILDCMACHDALDWLRGLPVTPEPTPIEARVIRKRNHFTQGKPHHWCECESRCYCPRTGGVCSHCEPLGAKE